MGITERDWLGENNKIGIDIWNKKYRQNGENFEQWLDRISGGNDLVKQLIVDKKFLFGGRILSNRGLYDHNRKVSLSNCYVMEPPEDNIESIFECAKQLARTFSYGGGCGVDIGKLRPRSSEVHNAAEKSTGAVSFMDMYSNVTDTISQNGRRGALMISIPCNHPDIEEFISVKSDLDKVTKANISIRITDEFMAAVNNDLMYKLEFKVESTGEKIEKEVRAKDIFRKICEANYDYAEPGVLFWDRIEDAHMMSNREDFSYAGVNPCFSGDMELLTVDGYKTFESLCDTDPYIYNVNGNKVKSKVWCSGEKEVIEVKLSNNSIICTPDHIFMTVDGNECAAKDLKGKRIMPCHIINEDIDKEFVKLGFMQGDGNLSRLRSTTHKRIEVNVGNKDNDIRSLFADNDFTVQSDRVINVHGYFEKMKALGFSENTLPERCFPSTYSQWNIKEKASFLQGCYSANGCVIKKGRVSYKTTCRQFAEELKSTLLNDFRIDSYITTNKSKQVEFDNGKYQCKESYDINIGTVKNLTKFLSQIGFYQQYKREQLSQLLLRKAPLVTNITQKGKTKVYDFTEPERHWGIVEGMVVHNCAEEPLIANGACLLGSINLSEFVENPFTEQAEFDFDGFRYAVSVGVNALNEVLDEGIARHPLEAQGQSAHDWRQIGLGIFGLADMLIKLGVTYGSNESINMCFDIAMEMQRSAVQQSLVLAKRDGAFPKCDNELLAKNLFLAPYIEQHVLDEIEKYGLRNSQLLTIAPTGTISTMLGVSGGIEPIFENYYTRKTESLHGEDVHYKIFTPIVEEYITANNLDRENPQLPEYFVTSSQINLEGRTGMQATWQEHIDASISSTINLPKETTVEQIEDLYMSAWLKGLKGLTIYRAGCKREGILTTCDTEEENKSTDMINSPAKLQRGDILDVMEDLVGYKRKLTTGCGTLHLEAYCDESNGQPLETFINIGSSGGCERNCQFISRLMSGCLRAGVPVEFIFDQAQSIRPCSTYMLRAKTVGDTSKGTSCPSAIGWALKDLYEKAQDMVFTDDSEIEQYFEEGVAETYDNIETCDSCSHSELYEEFEDEIKVSEEASSGECPECHEDISYEGGCVVCKYCGWSKCD
ncbi:ribonucleotide reductase alpha subunit [Clostridiales Family XIII bacterium PM5-7]